MSKHSTELSTEALEILNPKAAEKRKKRRAAKSLPYTIDDIKLALEMSDGNLTEAAKMLDTTRPLLARKIDYYPSLQKTLQNIVESKLDYTEDKLIQLVKEGNVTAITFFLRTKGKERGYTEKNLLEHGVDQSNKNSAALIEAMRQGSRSEPLAIEVKDYTWVEPEEK